MDLAWQLGWLVSLGCWLRGSLVDGLLFRFKEKLGVEGERRGLGLVMVRVVVVHLKFKSIISGGPPGPGVVYSDSSHGSRRSQMRWQISSEASFSLISAAPSPQLA